MIVPQQDVMELFNQAYTFELETFHRGVEQEIKNYCGWKLESDTYTNAMVDGTGSKWLWPGHKNITKLTRAAVGTVAAINIKHTTASSNAFAAVNYTDNAAVSLGLDVADGSSVSSVTELFSSSATLTALVAYINTQSGNGWSAELSDSNFGVLASTTLIEIDNLYTGTEDGTDPGFSELKKVGEPVRGVTVERTEGGLFREWCWPSGVKNIPLTYTAGWTTADMPGDLKSAVITLLELIFTKHQEGAVGVKSLSLTNYTISYITTDGSESKSSIPLEVLDVLDAKYRITTII